MGVYMRNPLRSLDALLAGEPFATRWQPAADIYRTADGWLVKVELAGVRPDEFEVRFAGQQLILRGRRRDWQIHDAGQCQSLEIVYDEFERRFDFPIDLTAARVETEYANGMLLLRIRHGEEQR
jgi:HSP20 family protein